MFEDRGHLRLSGHRSGFHRDRFFGVFPWRWHVVSLLRSPNILYARAKLSLEVLKRHPFELLNIGVVAFLKHIMKFLLWVPIMLPPQQRQSSGGISCTPSSWCPWGGWPSPPWSWLPRRQQCFGELCLSPICKCFAHNSQWGYSQGWWPDLLRSELREVFLAPILGGLTVVGRCPVLLEHLVAPSSHSVNPGLHLL